MLCVRGGLRRISWRELRIGSRGLWRSRVRTLFSSCLLVVVVFTLLPPPPRSACFIFFVSTCFLEHYILHGRTLFLISQEINTLHAHFFNYFLSSRPHLVTYMPHCRTSPRCVDVLTLAGSTSLWHGCYYAMSIGLHKTCYSLIVILILISLGYKVFTSRRYPPTNSTMSHCNRNVNTTEPTSLTGNLFSQNIQSLPIISTASIDTSISHLVPNK